ncbi:MAG: TIGR02677 family protein [Ilumatobacteraceae bacterium]
MTAPTPASSLTDVEDSGRRLFRYVSGDEWREYRSIMAVFANTFFSEFTPDDISIRLAAAAAEAGTSESHAASPLMDPAVVAVRLESLRGWGNLTVSSSVGNPANLADYYRRRNRYLITRVGQEVHHLVEGVLSRVDEVRDVSTGRLRSLREALAAIARLDVATADPAVLGDAVRAVFDPHETFTDEITQFFAAINQWQSRYDLSVDEFRFFAEVLVGYVADRLEEIERMARPIGIQLASMDELIPTIVQRMGRGLAARVEQAGLQDSVTVARSSGSTIDDWFHLAAWFVTRPGLTSRIERLGREAVSAIRTLTLNLTRLSRSGIGAASRRADFLRLAAFFDAQRTDGGIHRLAAAAFGLYPSNHFGTPAEDSDDPAPTTTSWWDGPRAPVPISIRERGEIVNRGRPTPIKDRSVEQRMVRYRREQERAARGRVDAELVAIGLLDGATLSMSALARVQQLFGRTTHRRAEPTDGERVASDGGLLCIVNRTPGRSTTVHCAEGTLRIDDLTIEFRADVEVPRG